MKDSLLNLDDYTPAVLEEKEQGISLDPAGDDYLEMRKIKSDLFKKLKASNGGTYSLENVSNVNMQAYGILYDKIKQGYDDGTRKVYVQGENGERKQLTEEEDLEYLDKGFDRVLGDESAFIFCQGQKSKIDEVFGHGGMAIQLPDDYDEKMRAYMKNAAEEFKKKYQQGQDNQEIIGTAKNVLGSIFDSSDFMNTLNQMIGRVRGM